MSDTVIKIENLSKLYRLGEIGTGTIGHDLNRWWQTTVRGKEDPYQIFGGSNDRTKRAVKGEHVWALKDVNLEIKQGEVMGIIGRNGAGKSTLLKLLSLVTSPTTGYIKSKGRIASLLEVGTGFHPEMTGRENIYMNGTIMGMNRREINDKLDEIVDFSGVAKYLDTPTKRYSSGMTVRLGFAVAAFLEPEILIVDEVLAVGDAEFQKQAIGKMKDISLGAGRTVLFVSHNMSSIKQLCTSAILIDKARVQSQGIPQEQVEKYLGLDSKNSLELIHKTGDKRVIINGVTPRKSHYRVFENVELLINYEINEDISKAEFFVLIIDSSGEEVVSLFQRDNETECDLQKNDQNTAIKLSFENYLMPGRYLISAGLLDNKKEFVDWVEHAALINVDAIYNDNRKYDSRLGKISIRAAWSK